MSRRTTSDAGIGELDHAQVSAAAPALVTLSPASTWSLVQQVENMWDSRAYAVFEQCLDGVEDVKLYRVRSFVDEALFWESSIYTACDAADPAPDPALIGGPVNMSELLNANHDAKIAAAAVARAKMQPHEKSRADMLQILSNALSAAAVEVKKRMAAERRARELEQYHMQCDDIYQMWLVGKDRAQRR